MQRWKNFFWISAGILALTAVAGSIAPSAIAQVRAALVRDMDSPVRGIRYNRLLATDFENGSQFASISFTPSIPAGKKLFLQSIGLHAKLTNDQSLADVRMVLRTPTSGVAFYVNTDFQADDGFQRHFTGNQTINTLLNSDEEIVVSLQRSDVLGGFSFNFCDISILGYLVDANP
jgi:hypothetical protein